MVTLLARLCYYNASTAGLECPCLFRARKSPTFPVSGNVRFVLWNFGRREVMGYSSNLHKAFRVAPIVAGMVGENRPDEGDTVQHILPLRVFDRVGAEGEVFQLDPLQFGQL